MQMACSVCEQSVGVPSSVSHLVQGVTDTPRQAAVPMPAMTDALGQLHAPCAFASMVVLAGLPETPLAFSSFWGGALVMH